MAERRRYIRWPIAARSYISTIPEMKDEWRVRLKITIEFVNSRVMALYIQRWLFNESFIFQGVYVRKSIVTPV